MNKEMLENKKKILEGEIEKKMVQLQNTDNIRNQYTTEIVELRGQIKMLEELIKEAK